MSMTVAPYLKDESMTQNVLIGTLLTDESFALSMNKLNYTDHHLNAPWFHSVNVGAVFARDDSDYRGDSDRLFVWNGGGTPCRILKPLRQS